MRFAIGRRRTRAVPAFARFENRFGSTNELGVFEMSENGMESVENPRNCSLSAPENAPGSAVAAVVEGARPLLVEVQALCAPRISRRRAEW
jgi:predicted ATP-dependent serine protease